MRLDALGDDLEAKRMSEADDGADDVALGAVLGHAGHERTIELDRIERKRLQVIERRVASTEVVEQDAHAEILELLHDGRRR